MQKKEEIITNIIKKLNKDNSGYTLMELLVTLAIFGIITAVAIPYLSLKRESSAEIDGKDQVIGILQQARNTAIGNTSAVRIKPDPAKPTNKFLVEIAKTRGCNSVTKLTQNASSTTDIKVVSSGGFNVGDAIKVGGTAANITGIPDSVTITLGSPISASTGAVVELADNWSLNRRLQGDDVTLPEDKGYNTPKALATFTADITNWSMCINSRGIVYIFNGNNQLQSQLTLTLTNTTNNQTKNITIKQGGAIIE
ncbi:prepilin-type N-terminal cleavage/methylation domain-containing protein [Geminocystis sp. GBBB08]|uniref:pilus assembly FimT family protein n=1 Tax=Geminocystis sp. GBBB08 TaxID=2604140 RepID=UPI0027E2F497|nr:prepilin-type N-terminal cleavage/methylation domain-containing protein [Geminocystis sp. GBBB08]MBL1209878.1 prepilin-type N-terminal cleavage/methylation domain-containing protein [Geminocystis sp. GBBB08]